MIDHSKMSLDEKVAFLTETLSRNNHYIARLETSWKEEAVRLIPIYATVSKDKVEAVSRAIADIVLKIAKNHGMTSVKGVRVVQDSLACYYSGADHPWTITIGDLKIKKALFDGNLTELADVIIHELGHGLIAIRYGHETVMGFIETHGEEFDAAMKELSTAEMVNVIAALEKAAQ